MLGHMVKRSYDQYCGLAAALDLLGERWTVLIIRDLLMGPKRFTDLLDRLPGIGTGLLSQRLRELEDAGVIEKTTLPPPAASTVYQLTPDGDALRPALLQLARWGMRRLDDPQPGQRLDVESLTLGLSARLDRKAADGLDGSYGLVLDEAMQLGLPVIAAVELLPVHRRNRRFGIGVARHFHEGEPSGTTGFPIRHDEDAGDLPPVCTE